MLQWVKNTINGQKKTALLLGVILLAVFCLANFLPVNPALAQSVADPNSELQTGVAAIEQPLGLPATDIRLIIARIIRAALGLMGVVLVILVIYAGFLWMTAGGNEDQIARAKKFLMNATVGLVIILSAYAIVVFVMRLLGIGEGGGNETPIASVGTDTQNFQGSGGLGTIIKDHYPMRDQTGVPMNAKIIISFKKPVKPDSFIVDTTGDGIFGDCKPQIQNWQTDCDQLKMDADTFDIQEKITAESGLVSYRSISLKDAAKAGAAALASYENDQVFTVVIRPNDYLGSVAAPTEILVHLGNNIRLDDALNGDPGAFDAQVMGNNYYEWKFTCSTDLDKTPPTVVSVYPEPGMRAPKNSVIQINFSEAMDPVGIQGQFSDHTSYYSLAGNPSNIFLKTVKSVLPPGNFRLTNGFKTLEFASALECGKNACGNKIFCLPVCDRAGADCTEDVYKILLRAASTLNGASFEAVPFTGIADAAGNALDGNNDKKVDNGQFAEPAFESKPDNYFWSFTVTKEIDAVSPYLIKMTPGVDAPYIAKDDLWTMEFSKRLRKESAYAGVAINEKPSPAERGDNIPLWIVPRTEDKVITVLHGNFLDGLKQYYFPVVGSALEDVNYNCFYPGKGPKDSLLNDKDSVVCDANNPGNCCPVSSASTRAFCCNGAVFETRVNTEQCFEFLKSDSR